MKYLQITSSIICLLLVVIAVQLSGLRQPTYRDMKEAYGKGSEAVERFHESLPVMDVHSVNGSVEVAGTVDVAVDADDWIYVRTDYQNPLDVKISR